MKTENLSTLRIHNLSQAQYDANKENGTLAENEIYLTPAPGIDELPINNSKNLITSGGVYEALQNIGNDSNNTSYIAGELIEIKDGVISSTLGTPTQSEIVIDIFTINNTPDGDSTLMPPWYMWMNIPITKNIYEGQVLHIYTSDINGDEIYVGQSVLYKDSITDAAIGIPSTQTGYYCTINSTESSVLTALSTGSLPVDNDNIPFVGAMAFAINNDGTGSWLSLVSTENHPNKMFKITETKMVDTFVKLPDEALTEGNLIEIRNGKISSTLGKQTIINTKQTVFIGKPILSGDYDNDAGIYIQEQPVILSTLQIGDIIDVSYTDASGEVFNFTDLQVLNYGGYG